MNGKSRRKHLARVSLFCIGIMLAQPKGDLCAQQEYTEFDAPRFAESIRLANVYTGVGRGLAAVQHNPAALEVAIAEMLMFSIGAEDGSSISASWWEEDVVVRYGFGLRIPVGELSGWNHSLDITFDYAFSAFPKQEDLLPDALDYTNPIALSAGIRFVP